MKSIVCRRCEGKGTLVVFSREGEELKVRCPFCNGTRIENYCRSCSGRGVVEKSDQSFTNPRIQIYTCPTCNGSCIT